VFVMRMGDIRTPYIEVTTAPLRRVSESPVHAQQSWELHGDMPPYFECSPFT